MPRLENRPAPARQAGMEYGIRLISGRQKGPVAAGLRAALFGLSLVYGAGLAVFLLPYRLGIRKRRRLFRPVISVGNLTFGGTGKTPTVRTIAAEFLARGLRPVILSRGHGGKDIGRVAIVSDGNKRRLSPAECGDEPAMLADMLPDVPIVMGKNRWESGNLAIQSFDPDVILLDDGLQYWQLHRDIDIVLVNAVEPFGYGRLMPRGALREPLSGLRRAKFIIITNSDKVEIDRLIDLKNRLAKIAPGTSVIEASHRPCGLRSLSGERFGIDWLRGRRVCTVCSIGSPDLFTDMVAGLGADVGRRFDFPDHHAWQSEEIEEIAAEALALDAEALVTTEKDAVKLPHLELGLPVMAVDIAMAFWQDGLADALLDTVGKFGTKK